MPYSSIELLRSSQVPAGSLDKQGNIRDRNIKHGVRSVNNIDRRSLLTGGCRVPDDDRGAGYTGSKQGDNAYNPTL